MQSRVGQSLVVVAGIVLTRGLRCPEVVDATTLTTAAGTTD